MHHHHHHHMHHHHMHHTQSAHAAQRAEEERRKREEEEILTFYSEVDVEQDWQFKIVRGDFKTLEKVHAVMEEQAAWGWVFVEKFDSNRIRFKRPASEAERDATRSGNPYSTKSKAAGAGCTAVLALMLSVTGGVCWLLTIIG